MTESMVTQADLLKQIARDKAAWDALSPAIRKSHENELAAMWPNFPRTAAQPEREAVLEEALKNIAAPVAYLQRQAEAEGNQLDGDVALRLAGNAEFLKRIAREALDAAALTTPAPADGDDGWQDIETAPETSRDGARIDVWLEPIPERQAKFMNPATEGRRLANAWFVERQDYTGFRNAHSFNGRELNWRATHWRPIPKKPAILSRLRGEGE